MLLIFLMQIRICFPRELNGGRGDAVKILFARITTGIRLRSSKASITAHEDYHRLSLKLGVDLLVEHHHVPA